MSRVKPIESRCYQSLFFAWLAYAALSSGLRLHRDMCPDLSFQNFNLL